MTVMTPLRKILDGIAPHNNVYRDRRASVRDKLAAMWEIGDVLVKADVTKPHSLGWTIQRETGGLVKRPTIFRSHKFRVIWPDKQQFLERFGGIRGLSSLVEMVPLLDPAQVDKHHVPEQVVGELVVEMQKLAPGEFKPRLDDVKKRYADGSLGKTYDRTSHLRDLEPVARALLALYGQMQSAVIREDQELLAAIRDEIPASDLRQLSTMCLALTTKENRIVCSDLPDEASIANNAPFRGAYEGAVSLLRDRPDTRRARFRKLIAPDVLADLAELCNAVLSDKSVSAYNQRARVTIPLGPMRPQR